MKTPKFWKDENIISFILYPFSIIYGFFRHMHVLFSKEYKTSLKIICIGNVTAGGSGKTPLAIKIGEMLKERNIDFAYLSKGYNAKIKEFTKIDKTIHNAQDVGDEPMLLAELSDTFICKNRRNAIENLSKNYNYEYIIMDDGFQNPTISKYKNIVVIDGEYGMGNGELLPSGPLRETLNSAAKRSDFFVIIGQDKQNIEETLLNNGIDVARAFVVEKQKSNSSDKYIAFCGIGRCEKFFNSLKKSSYNVIKEYSFGDHHNYKEDELEKIITEAGKIGAKLITTKKDWIKLSKIYNSKIEFLEIGVEFYDINKILNLLNLE
mgnify:CR=1 FL=1